MNLVRRLLNVIVLSGILVCFLAIYDWGNAALDYKVELDDQKSACDRWESEKSAHKNSEWHEFELVSSPEKELCDKTPSKEIFRYGRDEIAIGFGLLLFVVVLNYILFGKVTLWSRDVHVEKADDGGSIK